MSEKEFISGHPPNNSEIDHYNYFRSYEEIILESKFENLAKWYLKMNDLLITISGKC